MRADAAPLMEWAAINGAARPLTRRCSSTLSRSGSRSVPAIVARSPVRRRLRRPGSAPVTMRRSGVGGFAGDVPAGVVGAGPSIRVGGTKGARRCP